MFALQKNMLTGLPLDIFLLLLRYLKPADAIRCRCVCRAWNGAFRDPRALYFLLKANYPRCRELRPRVGIDIVASGGARGSSTLLVDSKAFDRVTARYYHLAKGQPRSVSTHNAQLCGRFRAVRPWRFHRSVIGEIDECLPITDPFWTYKDGLVVYAGHPQLDVALLDLDTDAEFAVPLSTEGKLIRNLRLRDRLLIIEWVYGSFDTPRGLHFASSFDVRLLAHGWEVVFRNEWQISPPGCDIEMQADRFYSTHSASHYVMYLWRPNRSLYTEAEDAPVESLFVWDISRPSECRPSRYSDSFEHGDNDGAFLVSSFSFRDLNFYGVQQRGLPALIRLDVNSEVSTIDLTESFYLRSPHWEGMSRVRMTSIPFSSHGPCWQRDVEDQFPPYSGSGSVNSDKIPLLRTGTDWYRHISEVNDQHSQVCFSLRFERRGRKQFSIDIRTPDSCAEFDHAYTDAIGLGGQICGDERYLIGLNDFKIGFQVLHFNR